MTKQSSKWLKDLNPEQKEAVQIIKGPMLVLAGAGSGKTLVITRRIAYMQSKGIKPTSILAVTFTNKAANEMRERLADMIGQAAQKVTLSTFHSLGLMMLRTELARRKKSSRFVVYDTADQLACLRELNRRIRLGRSFDLGAILGRISAYKNAFLEPKDVCPTEDEYDQAAAVFYPAYLEAMQAYAAVDFDDLICLPTKMMEKSEACRKRWSTRFRHVLVDEYQDTNGAQLRMLRGLAGKHRNLCVVGDDDQSIYGWRGAEVRNILQFEKDFPGCRTIYLMRNYRSVASVLTLANQVISQNENRHPKKLLPTRQSGERVKIVVSEDGESEAVWVAERVAQLVEDKRYKFSQVAVLYRSNLLSRTLETAFRSNRIPYRVHGGQSFFDRKEVKDLIAYLKYCANPADSISLRRIINWPSRGIGPTTLGRLSSWAETQDVPLFRAVGRANKILAPADRALSAIAGFNALITKTRRTLKGGVALANSVTKLVEQIDMHEEINKACESGKEVERRWESITDFIDGLKAYAKNKPKASLRDFLSQISLNELEEDSADESGNRATLSTLHGAKGLEFPLVFIIGLEEGYLPHDRVLNPHATDVQSGDIAEERRLCYVGITRARDELVLTRADKRLVNGKFRERAPSRFITELPDDILEVDDLTQALAPQDARKKLAEIKALLNN
ncbi:MAG: UvrD-helicase domain-containing protein [Deltaproteobacteria bacterium]|nr:UvrD-helicase domain-containing protein [Deltaproteobacteria bacterium]